MIDEIKQLISYSKQGYSGSFGDNQTLVVLNLPSGGSKKGDVYVLRWENGAWKKRNRSYVESLDKTKLNNLLPYLNGLLARAKAWAKKQA